MEADFEVLEVMSWPDSTVADILLVYHPPVLFKVMHTLGSSALVNRCPGLANNFIYVEKATLAAASADLVFTLKR